MTARTAAAGAPRRASMTGPLVKSIIFIVVTAVATAVLGISITNSGVSGATPTARCSPT